MKKLIAVLMALVLVLSFAACAKDDESETETKADTPDTNNETKPETEPEENTDTDTETKPEEVNKETEEIFNSVKKYFTDVKEITVQGSVTLKTEGKDDSVTDMVISATDIGGNNFALYVRAGEETTTFVNGMVYIKKSDGTKSKMAASADMFKDIIAQSFPYNFSDFNKSEVTEGSEGTKILTLVGLSNENFVKYVLGVSEDDFENAEAYQQFLKSVKAEADTATLTITLNSEGKVLEMVSSGKYEMMQNDGTSLKQETVEVAKVVDKLVEIKAPEDADSYVEIK